MVTLVKSGFSSSGGLPPAPRTGKAVSSPSRSTVNGEKEHLVSDSRHFQERAVNNSGENGRTAAEGGDESSNDIDLDLGEGTSASGPKLMVKMSRGVGQTHFDVATLLKDPIVFVAPRFYDDSNENIPYEPLPMGPQCQPPPGRQNGSLADGKHPSSTNSSSTVNDSSSLLTKGKSPSTNASTGDSTGVTSLSASPASSKSSVPIPMSWPQAFPVGPGYYNLGNTCFLNSTLQALTHTAPLVACLLGDSFHAPNTCKISSRKGFCLLCAMQRHVRTCFRERVTAMDPRSFVNNLKFIAKNMRPGRQEDAHEFLRFFLDGLQEAAAKNLDPPAKSEEEKDQTFVNRIFGGRLRSRVSCGNCKHDSDTFDRFMDLSIDVSRADSVKDALQAFVKVDFLQGANKYKCEKCKKLVNAQKQFTIQKAPQILHVHLKRFTPTGKKIVGPVNYPDTLQLGPYMSQDTDDRDPTYRLYAVVCHSGSGPHSGHYFAHVRSGQSKWYCMNDGSVTDSPAHSSLSLRNAYLLFYERSNRLNEALIAKRIPLALQAIEKIKPSPPSSLGKRKERDDSANATTKVGSPPAVISMGRPIQPKYPGFPNSPQQHQQHQPQKKASSPFQQQQQQRNSSSSPNRQDQMSKVYKQKPAMAFSPIRSSNFFSNQNRPRMVEGMTGRPRH